MIKNKQVSVIIPAYNESAVISDCLKVFLENDFLNNNQVIVICNACTDETAAIVSRLSTKFICLETDIPSKTNALNMGDEVAIYYPRIYLDADVIISIDAINAITEMLNKDGVLATSVLPKMVFTNSSWFVKAYYDVWLQLPYCKEGMIGSGLYALSETGRSRFDKFPPIIIDDAFVRGLFTKQERPLTLGHYAKVKAPSDLFSLIKIKTRGRLGICEMKEKFPELFQNNKEEKDYKKAFSSLIFNHNTWLKAIIYLGVNLYTRFRAKYQFIHGVNKESIFWERDNSARTKR